MVTLWGHIQTCQILPIACLIFSSLEMFSYLSTLFQSCLGCFFLFSSSKSIQKYSLISDSTFQTQMCLCYNHVINTHNQFCEKSLIIFIIFDKKGSYCWLLGCSSYNRTTFCSIEQPATEIRWAFSPERARWLIRFPTFALLIRNHVMMEITNIDIWG